MLTPARLGRTNSAKVMHCLPVRRDVELSAKLLDSPASLVRAQAANRVFAAAAVLKQLLEHNYSAVSKNEKQLEKA